MRILHLNISEFYGGAAKAANRLHKSLLRSSIDSKMFVVNKTSDSLSVIGPDTNYVKAMGLIKGSINNWPLKYYKSKSPTMFSIDWLPSNDIVKRINKIAPSIVHLHWVNGGMLKISDLAQIEAPIVWTLHDMWPFTGGCHYDEECGLYTEKCNHCKVLGSSRKKDLSYYSFQKKYSYYSKLQNMTIVGLSSWIYDSARRSTLFKNMRIVNLPNPIDTDLFKPLDKVTCRKIFNLPQDKKLILFGAMNSNSDPRKGYSKLAFALSKIVSDEYEVVIFGQSSGYSSNEFHLKSHLIGQVQDDQTLVALYNACDVIVVPSLQENLSNVIIESLSCGTPVVGFNIGGNGDMIEHEKNGYLANIDHVDDLSTGITWVLDDPQRGITLSKNARKKALKLWSSDLVCKQYVQLYESIVN